MSKIAERLLNPEFKTTAQRRRAIAVADRAKMHLASQDFLYFLDFVYILQPPQPHAGIAGGKIRFEKWPHLMEAAQAFIDHRLVDLIKARQLGFSWLLAAYATWTMRFHDGAVILQISQGEKESYALLRKAKYVYRELPESWQFPIDQDSGSEFSLQGMSSTMTALPSTEDAGRGPTSTLVIQDEADFHKYLDANYLAVKPTIDGGGQLILGSTVNKRKRKSVFTNLHRGAPDNGWHKLFWGWHTRGDRDENWYELRRKEAQDMPEVQEMGVDLYMEQEYPACLAPDTLISTPDESILPISESKHAFVSGEGWLNELRTEQGRKLLITDKHRIMTPSYGYQPLGGLKPGDAISLAAPTFSKKYAWCDLPLQFHNEVRSVKIDEVWGRFLGFFVGDGSIGGYFDTGRQSSQTVSIVCDRKDEDVIDLVRRDFTQLIGEPADRVTGSKKGCVELRKSRSDYMKLFRALGVVKPVGTVKQAWRKVCVPPVIFRSPKAVVREFLRGVWESDGFIQAGKPRMILYSKHEEFLQQVQFLMMGFGITSKIFIEEKTATFNGNPHKYTGRSLRLRKPEVLKFGEEIGFVGKRKRGRFETFSEKDYGSALAKPMVWADTIASVTPSHESVLWDATVRPDHWFSAAGIHVHNSIEEALRPSRVLAAFDADILEAMKAETKDPIRTHGTINIYQEYVVGRRYVAGSDPSHGVGGDYAVTVVMDIATGAAVADIAGNNISSEQRAFDSCTMLKMYNEPIWAIEDNEWGVLVIRKAEELEYPHLYERGPDKVGWHTDSNRYLLWGELMEGVNTRTVTVFSKLGLGQFTSVIRNPDKNGRIEGEKGSHDDYPFAVGIAWQMRKHAYDPAPTEVYRVQRETMVV